MRLEGVRHRVLVRVVQLLGALLHGAEECVGELETSVELLVRVVGLLNISQVSKVRHSGGTLSALCAKCGILWLHRDSGLRLGDTDSLVTVLRLRSDRGLRLTGARTEVSELLLNRRGWRKMLNRYRPSIAELRQSSRCWRWLRNG